MIKVLSVFGTRPEAIKMAPVIGEFLRHSESIQSRVCVTAQHRHMLDQVLELFEIRPDHDLDVMRKGQSPTQVAARVLEQLEAIIHAEQPDWVLVQGDTTTVMAASIAAYYARVKVGHVEAGLRTYDKYQPFPEEINRRIAGVIADLHFAPTEVSRHNLLSEGVFDSHIIVTGNPVIDALLAVAAMPFEWERSELAQIPRDQRIIMVTAHRRENFGQPIEHICLALRKIAEQNRNDVQIVFPVHMNPNIQEPVYRLLRDQQRINLLPPLDYLPLVHLMKAAHLVLTDSGGIQEEAPSLGKPVLVLRETTERPEAVEAGTVKLVGTNPNMIVSEVNELLCNDVSYRAMAKATNPYGDGKAAARIVQALIGGL